MTPPELAHITELQNLKLEACELLAGGSSNQSYRVRGANFDWVVRLNGARGQLDRDFECAVVDEVAAAGLGPEVISCAADKGYLITRYLSQPRWTVENFGAADAVKALARSLRRLHELRAPWAEPSQWQSELRSNLQASPLRNSQALRDGIGKLCNELAATGFDDGPLALCHHDLHAANILGTDPVRMVDWEYARWTHCAMDIAYLIQYHDLVPEQVDLLLEAYYGRSGRDAKLFIALAVRLAQYQELIWLAQQQGELPQFAATRLRALTLVLA